MFHIYSISTELLKMSKRKHCAYTLEFKLKLLDEVDQKKLTKSEICRKYGIPNPTLSTFIASREQIERARDSSIFKPQTKKMKKGNHEDLEAALFLWFKQTRSMNIPISGPIVMEKADEFATEMKIDFTPNTGWLERFKQRKGISFRAVCGEAASAPQQEANDWSSGILQKILSTYKETDIFNADETGLFFQCLPDKTLSLKEETCTGAKKSKNRLTILIATNMDGSEKLPPLVIGKSCKPRSFKNIKTLPLPYKANKKAWMTAFLFEEWLRSLDNKFAAQQRKVAMIVDNCTAHPRLENLRAMELIFLPPNTTSILQPCDQGIIKNFKQIYRKIVVKRMILHIEDQRKQKTDDKFLVSVLDAMHYVKSAWTQVAPQTIGNCFRHAGFVLQANADQLSQSQPNNSSDNLQIPNEDGQDESAAFGNLFERLKDLIPLDTAADAYLAVDDNLQTSPAFSTTEIVESLIQDPNDLEEEDGDGIETTPAPPSAAEARKALSLVQRFLEHQGNSEKPLEQLDSISDFVDNISLTQSRQSSITDFFKKK